MTTWTVHIAVAPSHVPDPDVLEHVGDHLRDVDAAVGVAHGRVHVDLTLDADDPVDAVKRALRRLRDTSLSALPVVQLEVIDETEAERRHRTPSLPELAGGKEAAELLGITKQRFHQLQEREDFPDPVIRLASGPVWLVDSLRGFERTWPRRPGRPPVSAAAG